MAFVKDYNVAINLMLIYRACIKFIGLQYSCMGCPYGTKNQNHGKWTYGVLDRGLFARWKENYFWFECRKDSCLQCRDWTTRRAIRHKRKIHSFHRICRSLDLHWLINLLGFHLTEEVQPLHIILNIQF